MKLPFNRQTVIGLCLGTAVCLLPGAAVSAAPAELTSAPLMLAQAESAEAEALELYDFINLRIDEIMSDVWEAIEVAGQDDPDAVIKLGSEIINPPNNLSPQLISRIKASIQKAKEQKRNGVTVDPEQHARDIEAVGKIIIPRIEQNARQLYTGAKPLILKLAQKDPKTAEEFCQLMQEFLPSLDDVLPAATQASYKKMYNDLEDRIKDINK